MLPKIKAAMGFVNGHPNRSAIIADLSKVEDALKGLSGTKIIA
ncbi:putative amino acid kinase [Chlamydia trachomatis]|nr:putative amino acid kinase [Chlamydia trachomatis]